MELVEVQPAGEEEFLTVCAARSLRAAAGDPMAKIREAAGLPQNADIDTVASALSFKLRKAPGYWRVVADMIGADPNGTRDELEAALADFLRLAESEAPATAARRQSSIADDYSDVEVWQAPSQEERNYIGSIGNLGQLRRGSSWQPRVSATRAVSAARADEDNLTALRSEWERNPRNERGVPLQQEFQEFACYEAYCRHAAAGHVTICTRRNGADEPPVTAMRTWADPVVRAAFGDDREAYESYMRHAAAGNVRLIERTPGVTG
ncbi:MAG: hypothetical protein AB1716_04350 [Planctomycetota bacterium]